MIERYNDSNYEDICDGVIDKMYLYFTYNREVSKHENSIKGGAGARLTTP